MRLKRKSLTFALLLSVASGLHAGTGFTPIPPSEFETKTNAECKRETIGISTADSGAHTHAAAPLGKTQHLTSPEQTPQGLAKSEWKSIRAAYEAERHAFHPVAGQDGVWQALNPGQQWTTIFDGRGFVSEPKGGGWQWGLELKRYGFPGATRAISGLPEVKAEGQRLTYGWDTAVQEWWVNDTRGLEHGFTVRERPAAGGDAATPLQFDLAVRGSLSARIVEDGLGVEFLDGAGDAVLTYAGLKVWDADGKALQSHFEPINASNPALVTLSVDERGAHYPLTIDPIAQQAYLKSGNNFKVLDDRFGYSVSVSGDTVVVGAYQEDSSTTGVNSTPNINSTDTGAAYVFVRSGTTWTPQAYLKASNTGANDKFGISVAVSGDTVVVGSYLEDSSTTGVNSAPDELASAAGAAYVFVRSGTTWSQQAYLKASNNGANDCFGWSVAVSGDTVVVGARYEDSSTTGVNSAPNELADQAGAAYVFVRSGTTWSQQAYLKASNNGRGDLFGASVTISGDTVVVGAYGEQSSTTGVNSTPDRNAYLAGAAYVFVRSGTTWNQQAYLKASNTGAGDMFGYSVSVSSDTVVVGAYKEGSNTTGVNSMPNELADEAGAAYVFVRSGNAWIQQAYLKASNTRAGAYFGNSVAVSGDTVVVGATNESSSTTGVNSTPDVLARYAGAAYVFVRNGTTWSQQAYLKASNTGPSDYFGESVAVSGDTVVVGAFGEASSASGVNSTSDDDDFTWAVGAAYVFVRSGTTWSQQAYLKASRPEDTNQSTDQFGYSVAVSGDTVVVGAYGEQSSTTGVNSTPDVLAGYSGAAYVFVRNGTTWTQQAYLKASNTETYDYFGISVAVSGDTVVVGARQEDSSTTGINGNQSDNSAQSSGAAYVFVRSGTTWTQQAYLKASNTGAGDSFGNSVAVSGDTVVVGAAHEDSSTTGVNSIPNESARDSGAAYVFLRSGTTWSQQAYLKAGNTGVEDNFGISAAVWGDTVVVGARHEDSSTTGVNGTPDNLAIGSGAAYVFVRSGMTWSQQAFLKASNTGADDYFGTSVAVSGETVVVGADGEDSSTTGVNSTPDELAWYSGAAYVFVRSGTTWVEQAYLKASNYAMQFGRSVAISGDTAVIGAFQESSSTTGVNTTPDEFAINAGAAYAFVRNGTTWSQQAYLKASNTGAGDFFGISVAISGDTAVVGAYYEDSTTSGVNSTPNNLDTDSGAAYIFTGLPVSNTGDSGIPDGVADIWENRYGITTFVPSNDLDHDGLSDLLEAAFNLDPSTSDATQAFSQSIVNQDGNQYLQMIYRRGKLHSGITLIPYRSTDFAPLDWSSEGIVQTSVAEIDAETDQVTVRSSTPISGQVKQFMRLRADYTPPPP